MYRSLLSYITFTQYLTVHTQELIFSCSSFKFPECLLNQVHWCYRFPKPSFHNTVGLGNPFIHLLFHSFLSLHPSWKDFSYFPSPFFFLVKNIFCHEAAQWQLSRAVKGIYLISYFISVRRQTKPGAEREGKEILRSTKRMKEAAISI